MISLRVHSSLPKADPNGPETFSIGFDTEDGIETLPYQILSILNCGDCELEAEELIIVDKNGRQVTSLEEILDIQFVPAEGELSTDETTTEPSTINTAEVWVFPQQFCDFNKYCSNNIPDTHSHPGHASDLSGCVQPSFRIIDMPHQICSRCRWFFDPSLIVTGSASNQSESTHLQCFQCDIHKLIDIGLAPPEASESLKTESDQFMGSNAAGIQMPIMLYLRRTLLQQTHAQIRNTPAYSKTYHSREYQEFKARVASGARTVMVYEDPAQQEIARQHIDYAKVYEYALRHLGTNELPPAQVPVSTEADSRNTTQVPYSKEVQELEERALLVGLMAWFKVDFFKWCNKPACENPACNAPPGRMDGVGTMEPTPEEKNIGGAGRTEVYKCRDCNQHTRFPRFNNPAHLLTTRRGRCGEFANAFCLICRALHLDAQYVLDFTDHVWVEVWLPSVQRFVHCDPCERAQDTPLMYEQGWNKKLTHVLSFSRYGVSDSIARYSRKQNTVLTRRCAEVLLESCVAEIVATKDKELEVAYAMRRASLPPPPAGTTGGMSNASGELPWDVANDSTDRHGAVMNCLRTVGQGRGAVQALCGRDVSWAQLQQRKRLQQRELLALSLSTDTTNSTYSKQGRISGDLEWKLSRGEAGDAPNNGKDSAGAGTASAAQALCSTDGPAKVSVPLIAAPAWLQQVPAGQRVLFHGDAHRPTDVLLATYDNPLLPCDTNLCAAPAASYQWGGELFPKVANCGESFICLGSSGKSMSMGTAHPGGNSHIFLPEAAVDDATNKKVVTVTRNGVAGTQAAPQYTAFSYSLPGPHAATAGMTGDVEVTLSRITNFACTVPSSVWFPSTGSRSVEEVTNTATEKCCSDKSVLGFTLIFVDNNVSGDVSHVLYFGAPGNPLVAINNTVSYVKTVPATTESSVPASRSTELCTRRDYYHLGGACHNDTTVFDSVAFLQSFALPDGTTGAAGLRLSKISVWAGDTLVNGVQCTFTLGNESDSTSASPMCITSPKCSSDNDYPVEQVLTLEPDDRVISVQCRSGALVDSIMISTLRGKVLRAGGGGGDKLTKIDIPEGLELCGFFGGTGGHLHHMGVVFCNKPANPSAAPDSATAPANADAAVVKGNAPIRSSLYLRVLALCQQHTMTECGMLQYYDSTQGTKLYKQSNVPLLAELVSAVVEQNTPEIASSCLRTIATYINNILKDPTERKYQTIKLSNSILQQNVLQAHGGIALLLFGPAAFTLTISSLSASLGQQVVQSALASEILLEDKSTSFRTKYVAWLRQYVGFLTAALELIAH